MPMPKIPILKNARNYAEYLRKKDRGPVKAFFHITKNENIPAIERQGLLTEHPNANVNSADHPFRKHGTDAGGVWVTTEPLAFPVYGTTIGGKHGNAAARADALSTIKIEVPVSELPTMRAVQDPYGKNILRKGDDPRAIEPFPTWANENVPTTVFLDDMKPGWLTNLGYVEEARGLGNSAAFSDLVEVPASWGLPPKAVDNPAVRGLSKGDFKEFIGYTGHRHGLSDYDKSQRRFVDDYLDKNLPITARLPVFPKLAFPENLGHLQSASYEPKYIRDGAVEALDPINAKRYSTDFIPAFEWKSQYRGYVKPGLSPQAHEHTFEFVPGAISRGMGGSIMPSVKERNFNWNRYKRLIAKGAPPDEAARAAAPETVLDWDKIEYKGTYAPKQIDSPAVSFGGAISRGLNRGRLLDAQAERATRRVAADIIRNKKVKANEYLSRNLGRQPTAEEVDNWVRAGIFNDIEAGELMDVPVSLGTWADKTDWDITQRLSDELFKRMNIK